ncbi:putative UDP-glucose 4-epimerase [Leptodontidium sp. 2 PMI_412]|nr:putative UDP-glucose 4-epimerase [Leptodontidium sp. 2 PMI_412]
MEPYSNSGSPSQDYLASSPPSELDTPSTALSSFIDDGDHLFDLPPLDGHFILVVGGLGYIGSHTSLELLKAGYNIVIVDNLSNSYRSVFERLETLAGQYYQLRCQRLPLMKFHEADYRDKAVMKSILDEYVELPNEHSRELDDGHRASRIDGVIHFAAYKSIQESIQQPLKYYANNVAGLVELCSVLSCYDIKTLIFSSSATVYGSIANSGVPLREEYCVHQPTSFIDCDGNAKTVLPGCTGLTNPYGRTKWMCEAILADLALSDLEWTIVALRYFNPVGCDESGILGEDPRGTPTNLMPIVVRVLTGLSPVLHVFGTDYSTPDGTAIRDFIHVTDLARGHVAALVAASDNRIKRGFRTYNLGSGKGNSVLEVVATMESASGTKIPIHTVKRREGDVGICVAVPTKAERELDWKTEKSIESSCMDICNALKVAKLETIHLG